MKLKHLTPRKCAKINIALYIAYSLTTICNIGFYLINRLEAEAMGGFAPVLIPSFLFLIYFLGIVTLLFLGKESVRYALYIDMSLSLLFLVLGIFFPILIYSPTFIFYGFIIKRIAEAKAWATVPILIGIFYLLNPEFKSQVQLT